VLSFSCWEELPGDHSAITNTGVGNGSDRSLRWSPAGSRNENAPVRSSGLNQDPVVGLDTPAWCGLYEVPQAPAYTGFPAPIDVGTALHFTAWRREKRRRLRGLPRAPRTGLGDIVRDRFNRLGRIGDRARQSDALEGSDVSGHRR